jgi:hypothetical protein
MQLGSIETFYDIYIYILILIMLHVVGIYAIQYIA